MTIQLPASLKKTASTILFCLLLALAAPTASAQILTGSVGTGDDISYLLIENIDFGPDPLVYAYHYTYDSENLLDGYDLFSAVLGAFGPQLSAVLDNYGTVEFPNYFVDSITYDGLTLANTEWPDTGPYWAQWVSGGKAGYPTAIPIASGTWEYGSGLSATFRTLAPGSWDGYTYNSESIAPSISPVPEPTILVLLGIGGIALLLRRRPTPSDV